MFLSQNDDKAYADRVITQFCDATFSDEMSTSERLKSIQMILPLLRDFARRFDTRKPALQKIQAHLASKAEIIKPIAKTEIEQAHYKYLFNLAAAMNTLIFTLNEANSNRKQCFIDTIESIIISLEEKEALLLESVLLEQENDIHQTKTANQRFKN